MRISFSCKLVNSSGKQTFATRLSTSMRRKNIIISNKNPDVNLIFVKGFRKGCKNILRLDGIWMNKKIDCVKKNNKISSLIKKTSGVIYQNNFCKLAASFFCKYKPLKYDCIPNGSSPEYFLNEESRKKPFFFSASHWKPHKRLKEQVLGFLESGLKKEYDLVIAGDPDYIIKDESITYLGKIPNHRVLNLTAGCCAYVHLAYIDWCPNCVVDALVARKPVIHTSSGGTAELVKNDGVCINDKSWNFDIIDHYSPPKMNIDEIINGYKNVLNISVSERRDLYIDNVCDRYLSFIESVLYDCSE